MSEEKKLNQLENQVNLLKEKKIRTEEQLKNLRSQKDVIIAELVTFGITPKGLDNAINELAAEIHTKLADIDTQIPDDIE